MTSRISYALLITIALSGVAEAFPPDVERSIGVLEDFQTHGIDSHLHTSVAWQPLVRLTLEDVEPGEVWDIASEAIAIKYDRQIAFSTRIMACQDPCERGSWGAIAGPFEILGVQGVDVLTASLYSLISRAGHYVVPSDMIGRVHLELQVAIISWNDPQNQKVYFTPERQTLSIVRFK